MSSVTGVIQSLYTGTVNTKNGEKAKYDVYFDPEDLWPGKGKAVLQNDQIYSKNGHVKVSVFQGQWNADWDEGQEVELEIEKNEYNGNIYLNGKCPEHLKPQRGGGSADLGPVFNHLNALEEKMKTVLKNQKLILETIKEIDTGRQNPPENETKGQQGDEGPPLPEEPPESESDGDILPF